MVRNFLAICFPPVNIAAVNRQVVKTHSLSSNIILASGSAKYNVHLRLYFEKTSNNNEKTG
jgi:hypothetical protein